MTAPTKLPEKRAADVLHSLLKTTQGTLRGFVADGVHTFYGVPYAAPPFGFNRLLPPQPREPWTGARDALTYGAMPPQLPYPPPWDVLIRERGIVGEDCLNLNIWTPELGAAQLPVMVWIPGGMFECGSGATYDGSQFARDGVVCVTINYRVGAEGFLYLGEGNANRGLLDQIAALEWVRDNIRRFGGDPTNVTIFGQSAGGMSVGTLLSMPRADGLFQRAIAQSGGGHQVMSVDSARKVARQLAERLGVEESWAGLAAIPVDRMLQAQAELKTDLMARPDPERWGNEVARDVLPWEPVIDGNTVPARPIERIAAGSGSKIELMAGSTIEESNFFLVPTGIIDRIPPEAVAGAISAYGLPVESTLAAYREMHPGAGPGELLSAVQSDWLFRIPALRLAETHAERGAATYMYEFAWRSPEFGGRLGACHGLEITFLFPNHSAESLAGASAPGDLGAEMRRAWAAFATNGNPGWPKYDLTRRATMRFDAISRVMNDPQRIERLLWKGVR